MWMHVCLLERIVFNCNNLKYCVQNSYLFCVHFRYLYVYGFGPVKSLIIEREICMATTSKTLQISLKKNSLRTLYFCVNLKYQCQHYNQGP